MPAAAPPPPPRRTRRACFDVVRFGEAFACADSGRFGARPVRRRSGRLPVIVRDGLVGAADEQRHGGFGGASPRRIVQRCQPAGRGGHGCHRRHRRPLPTTAPDGAGRQMAHPPLSLVSTSARAPSSAATNARSTLRTAHISAVSPKKLRTAGPAEGVSPRSISGTLARVLTSPFPDRGYTPGAQGAAPQKNDFKIPEWPTKKGSGGSGHTRHTARRIPRLDRVQQRRA